MRKRLQIRIHEAELRDLRDAARRQGMSVSEWVRRALREARRREPSGDITSKRRAVQAAMRHEGPTADIDQMLAEIEAGYGTQFNSHPGIERLS